MTTEDDSLSRLYSVLTSKPADATSLLNLLISKSLDERNRIANVYRNRFSKSLFDDVTEMCDDSEERGHLSVILCKESNNAIRAHEIRKAILGVGSDVDCLIDIICTTPSDEMDKLQEVYSTAYKISLINDIKGEMGLNEDLKNLLISLVQKKRSTEVNGDEELAIKIANELYNAGEAVRGTDEDIFIKFFSIESYAQLNAVFQKYKERYKKSIEEVIKNETSGSFEKALLALVTIAKASSPHTYFSMRIHDAKSSIFTSYDHKVITRFLVQCSNDNSVGLLKEAFKSIYNKNIDEYIFNKIKTDSYKRTIQKLLDQDIQTRVRVTNRNGTAYNDQITSC